MATFFRLLIFATLSYCLISNEVPVNDPVVLPALIELVKQMEENRKDEGEQELW